MEPSTFGSVQAVEITVLVDNRAGLITKSRDGVRYFTDKALLAEHGFSALVHFPGDPSIGILWDAGVTRLSLLENLRRMEIDPHSIQQVALSHGHSDHIAALTGLLETMELGVEAQEWDQPVTARAVAAYQGARRLPLVAHPAAFRERWGVKEDGTWVGPYAPPPRQIWEAMGLEICHSEGPYKLAQGCWTTGYIPRESFEHSGRPARIFYRQGDDMVPDDLDDDQAIVVHVQGKGLVVLSGCAHAGIINTINHARQISGVERVHAVIGGFHLVWAEPDEIQKTIKALQALKPAVLVPCHCTGFEAMCAFAREMPAAFLPGVVGATYVF
jgi:7,8-dihydropterin-6-yl-methyl-4-(beta-D-ribofuranosyl)aminobenzene 5'-phosphate synthase